ncbi:MAG: hypothetical protein AAFY76_04850, partial [Cyanobacteria bacterium J06649_11]
MVQKYKERPSNSQNFKESNPMRILSISTVFLVLMEGSWGQSGANQYQYNGKELNEDFGLEWLDYGA